jgi:ABC-type phosphate/phosphonate transport system substrate-binding protein
VFLKFYSVHLSRLTFSTLCIKLQTSLGPDASPVDIATGAVKLAEDLQKSTGKPFTVIVDTAGRQVLP